MGIVKKNKLHNPQIITDSPPATVTEADIGRLWVDKTNNTVTIAIGNKIDGTPELRNILDTGDLGQIDLVYYSGIETEYALVELQTVGDSHYDDGYDFFTDTTYLKNATQEFDDFYSYYYKEVPDTSSNGYLRTISTDFGVKHIRASYGLDTYKYNNITYNLTNYTKIILSKEIKTVLEIKFDNKDTIEHGFSLSADNKTILLYCDPEGFFNTKSVTVKYLI